ncbi:MAG: ATP-binding protein [Anaerolineae bacterium]|nr:ATP-binding protein [Anaerolineae bacterium]
MSHVPRLIIIGGPPGSGKTALARALAAHVTLPLMSKDMIKESLFDSLGWHDRAWSMRLGRASIALLFQFAEAALTAGQSCIIECNFDPQMGARDVMALHAHCRFTPIQIVCWARPEMLVERLERRARSGERHPGHIEADLKLALANVPARLGPLDIGGHVFEVDTTDFARVDYSRLFGEVARLLRAP